MTYLYQEKQAIKELLIQMNELLSEHIEVHNALFNPPLRAKIPIPFVMKKIDMKVQYEKAQGILISFEECLDRAMLMNKFNRMNNATYQTINEYGQYFLLSVGNLTNIAYELHLKAERKNKLSYKEFKDMVNEYEESERVRLSSGDKLNKLVKEYFQ
ncbi:hypothetical protein [Bacillus sp. FJAT-29937]|uniref:hypothetical protein n=1 Tax=Bacillus sp. FJAT-29937 TaxID=1720553 RepID=UPI00082FB33C|nr:hypothetical protein [Bacillus sp. FJAT-29937]